MHQRHQQYANALIIFGLHAMPFPLGAWTAHLWHTGHELLTLFIGAAGVVTAVALWVRDRYLAEVAEALSPTTIYRDRTTIEPPRPLPAFPVEENPSRVRIRPLVDSVAPEDADNETTWPEVG